MLHRRRWRPSWFGSRGFGLRGATRTGLAAGVRPTGQPERPWPTLRALGSCGAASGAAITLPPGRRDASQGSIGPARAMRGPMGKSAAPNSQGAAAAGRQTQAARRTKQAARGRTNKQPAHAEAAARAARGRTQHGGRGQPRQGRRLQRRRQRRQLRRRLRRGRGAAGPHRDAGS